MKYFINEKEVTKLEFDTALDEQITEQIYGLKMCRDKDSAIERMYKIIKEQLNAGMTSIVQGKMFKIGGEA